MGEENTGKDLVKVVKTGGSLTVTLPAAYVKATGIVKGNTMALHYNGDIISYRPHLIVIEDIVPVNGG